MRRPILVRALAAASSAVVAWIAAGPIAAMIAMAYAWVLAAALWQRRRDADETTAARTAMDRLVALVADIRAGAEPTAASAALAPSVGPAGATGALIASRVGVAIRITEVTGARLGDLLDRVDADVRAVTRVRDLASAHVSGVRATAALLAGLPVAGIALGAGIGADPLRVLLHTRLGAADSVLALALQMLGLAWTRRLAASAKGIR
jgi:tight adherence protein B